MTRALLDALTRLIGLKEPSVANLLTRSGYYYEAEVVQGVIDALVAHIPEPGIYTDTSGWSPPS